MGTPYTYLAYVVLNEQSQNHIPILTPPPPPSPSMLPAVWTRGAALAAAPGASGHAGPAQPAPPALSVGRGLPRAAA